MPVTSARVLGHKVAGRRAVNKDMHVFPGPAAAIYKQAKKIEPSPPNCLSFQNRKPTKLVTEFDMGRR